MIYKKIDTSEAVFCNVSEEHACEYIDHRINKKKPLTQGAFNRAMKAAVKCVRFGLTPDEAIEMVCDKGWDGVTPEYIVAELAKRYDAISTSSNGSLRDNLSIPASVLGQLPSIN